MADLNGEKSTGGNLNGVLSPVHPVYKIDETLTKGGYAADAKATGDALAGKAPASHATDKNNPHGVTAAQVGAAPSGYGWGETQTSYNPPYADPDNVDRTCVFSCSQGNIPRGGIWRGVAQFQNADNGQMVVRSYTNGEGVVARRYKINGEWKPWEYENPWMTPGAEYRTAEMWDGSPVFTKVINCGALPNSSQKSVSLGASDVTNVLRVSGTRDDGESLPLWYNDKYITVYASVGNIYLRTNHDYSSRSAYVQVWYIK